MGAYLVMFPKAKILTLILIFIFPLFVELSAFFYIGFWFLLQLFSGTLSLASQATEGGVAWWGHVGGFIAGVVLLPFFRSKKVSHRKRYPDETYNYISH
jgi:membrane associated rhomboid family serine protease